MVNETPVVIEVIEAESLAIVPLLLNHFNPEEAINLCICMSSLYSRAFEVKGTINVL